MTGGWTRQAAGLSLDGLDPWQVPVLVMAAIIPVALLSEWVLARVRTRVRWQWVRLVVFALLTVLVLVAVIVFVDLSQADQLASVASAIFAGFTAFVMLWRSYQSRGAGRSATRPPDDHGRTAGDDPSTTGGDAPVPTDRVTGRPGEPADR